MAASSNFRVEPASEADFPALAAIVMSSFAAMPVEAATSGPPTRANISAAAGRYLEAARRHQQQYSPCPAPFIKCVRTDPDTGVETIVGTAQWYIYPRVRTPEEVETPHYLLGCSWISDQHEDDGGSGGGGDTKSKATRFFKPFLDGRVRLLGDRPHGVLMYMAVTPEWRRQGVATMCVQWGTDRCQELGIPAYLEASDEGAPVYQGLGFEIVDSIESEWEGVGYRCPIMIKYPTQAG
ncbi:acyl-CoA N-acyltransferase [Microdochium bolleyi]|uniref:Acyl-CoA N-acyltransferase n=1 Tax=Microdochium bolleyi TaxID=196109 RepID=A0A136IT93_9PEZI|nr:acyl-CoA N-acyltransferase [Microdochium bolleyi]